MNASAYHNTIVGILKKIAPDSEPSQLQPNDDIREVLGIDSFDLLQFIIALDKELGIEIPEQDYGEIVTLAKLTDYITLKKPGV